MTKNIEYNKIVKRGLSSGKSKVKCEGCGQIKRMKHMAKFKKRILCSNCKPHIMMNGPREKARVMRIYTVKKGHVTWVMHSSIPVAEFKSNVCKGWKVTEIKDE
jgi:hypothetical protein